MTITMKPQAITAFPVSKGSTRLESPPGESLKDFYTRFMFRKAAKTGWRSGRLDRNDTKLPTKEPLAKPFISLLGAMQEAGFVSTLAEAELALQALAIEDPTAIGISRKDGGLRYWIPTQNADTDF